MAIDMIGHAEAAVCLVDQLSEPLVLDVGGQSFPIVWSIIGAALFVALLHFMSGRRRWLRA